MPETREGLAGLSLGSTKEAEQARVIDWLVALGDDGMASGVDDTFDIDAFIEDTRASR
jgi:hypothetical protein